MGIPRRDRGGKLADSWTAALQCCTAQHTCHGTGRLFLHLSSFPFWILKTNSGRRPRHTKNPVGRAEDTASERVRQRWIVVR